LLERDDIAAQTKSAAISVVLAVTEMMLASATVCFAQRQTESTQRPRVKAFAATRFDRQFALFPNVDCP
jgi:hypothetical protein